MNTVIDVLNFVKNWKINNGYSDGAIVPFHTYVACTAPSAVVFSLCQCRHTRSTLRHNCFCGYRWDNYPIYVSVAKTGVFVRDSNSAVTVKLPTRKPTDTHRR